MTLAKQIKPATTPIKKNNANKTGVKNSKLEKPGKVVSILPTPKVALLNKYTTSLAGITKAIESFHSVNVSVIRAFLDVGGKISASAAAIVQWVLQSPVTPTAGQRTAMARALLEVRKELGYEPVKRGAQGGRSKGEADEADEADDEPTPAKHVKHASAASVAMPLDLFISAMLMYPLDDQRRIANALGEALRKEEIGARLKALGAAKF